ncbi:MAG TPA: D-alanyl-D-alanine dipeptidase [Flavobacterium sp.]|nr:D-alanyl-D-alanine dipeptidase [Flavobacterium sp.]MBP6146909.1 D-alanyl-D-alanine dipeptidase [Flavobacterium sp.]MBP7182563.1 D-alanyl-D-alanine dipeptidase [Flavobacterium sp.]MBP7319207.1 D-alanyl-D-alanine dipeptidase [Flavobacterium sp.]MBP8888053.1 D-alanyl-D-alanine dipeptidase [Flavobacterium sp.]HRL71348.1 D-alanyl-D-alanine dipeptidase [Flavobacterium sp.]
MKFYFKSSLVVCSLFWFVSCKSQNVVLNKDQAKETSVNDSTFVNLKQYSQDFEYDMKYATEDNFLKAKVYDCAECFLRLKTVNALIDANKKFLEKGYKIKIFDCYRPLDIQKKMWKIVSNPKYVADPAKGSIHNRGGAVDITLIDSLGKELDMGTPFDFFGIEASHNYPNVSDNVKQNRILLKTIMTSSGFNSFDSEWWHYNLKTALNDAVSNAKWDCK